MEKLEELLPGIEEFLCTDLAEECLSETAEEKRQYFIERLDILKLPPTLPPRRPVSESHSSPLPLSTVTTELTSPTLSQNTFFEDGDFAAHQREISRSLVSNENSDSEEKEVKVYDDIDTGQPQSPQKTEENTEDHDYEIPVVKQTPTATPAKSNDTNGYEETTNQKTEPEVKEVEVSNNKDGEPIPPPLPPRRERTASDAHSRSSIGSLLEDKPPNLPIRPNVPTKTEVYNKSENSEKLDMKSDKSEDHTEDFTDDADATSYESYDEQEHDIELMNKLDIKLPKPLKKSKKHKKLSKSRSSKEWDINLPFNCLEEVILSGELQYKGKLSWTKKIAALCDGRMVCYKPDKTENKPSLVIQLTGYSATYNEKETRKGFDIRLTHPDLEVHNFSVDLKDWAQMWCDYISAMAQGRAPPGQYHHLARTLTFSNGLDNTYSSKSEYGASISNLSTASSDGLDHDNSTSRKRHKRQPRVKRMGSIAFRATQFFEAIGKKGKKFSFSSNQSPSLTNLRERSSSSGSTPATPLTPLPTPVSEPDTPVFPLESQNGYVPEDDFQVQIKGHLNIFSSFNKRKWGKRWCLVRDNRFECYRSEKSMICELDFLLRNCILRRAIEETKSELGLMLLEMQCEKITVEPLSQQEMGRWLKILMNETSTENLPEGLGEYWVEEDESPYHDIKPHEMTSPKSEDGGYSCITSENTPRNRLESTCESEESSPNSDANKTLTSSNLENTTNFDLHDASQVSTDSHDHSNSYIPGELTGELYSKVRKNSVTDEISEINNSDMFTPLGGSTFNEVQRSYNSCVVHSSGHKFTSSVTTTRTNIDAFFLSENDMKEDSLFAEILTNINKRFSEHDSDKEESPSEMQTDTAYNSATCSENSSLERKNRTDSNSFIHSQNDLDCSSQTTDRQNSPIEDNSDTNTNERIIEIQVESPIISYSRKNVHDQSNERSYTADQSNERNFSVDQSKFSSITKTEVIHEQTSLCVETKSSRDQCDSAIFEGESILEDEASLIHKIDQLRTHLVELKKNRISVRDRKMDAESQSQKLILEDEYNRLDEECKMVSDEIASLESQLSR